jgi:hypothetical protein
MAHNFQIRRNRIKLLTEYENVTQNVLNECGEYCVVK